MDNLGDWVVSVIAVAVGLSRGLAILSARSIARLLHRALWPHPEAGDQVVVGQLTKNWSAFQLHECEGPPAPYGLLTAAVLVRGLIDG